MRRPRCLVEGHYSNAASEDSSRPAIPRLGDPSPPVAPLPSSGRSEAPNWLLSLTVKARLSSGRVAHVWGDQEPVDLPASLSFSVGGRGTVVRRRSDNRVSPRQWDGELVRLKVPVTAYDVGVVSESMDMREHFVQEAPVPLTRVRVRFVVPVQIEDVERTPAHLQMDDHVHPAPFRVVYTTVWHYCRDRHSREDCQSSLWSATSLLERWNKKTV
eukprot:1871293-Amphidinium_carterae.1